MTDEQYPQGDDIEGMPFYCERCGFAAIGTGNLCRACQREEDASEGIGVQTMYAGRYDGHDD
jgi:hypothetical protein